MMNADNVREVLDVLANAGITVVVDGGWGVDALLGEEIREHDDLDLHLSVVDADLAATVLAALGYVRRLPDGRPANFVLCASGDRRVDLHALRLDAEGGGVYELADGTDWIWPPGSFSGTGVIGGRPVACLSAEAQVLGHTGYELGETDHHDLALLRQRFGVTRVTRV